jgi:hypothetical protein
MMDTLDLIEKRLKELKAGREEYITQNNITSWDEYKHVTGIIFGLRLALSEIEMRRKVDLEE